MASKNPEVEITIHNHSPKMGYSSSPEISKLSPKPPKYPSPEPPLIRQRTFNKGKPKSRFGEPSVPIDSQILENYGSDPFEFDPANPNSEIRVSSFAHNSNTPKSKGCDKGKGSEGPDEKEIYQRVTAQLSAINTKKMAIKYLCQFFVFSVLLGLLVSSITIDRFKDKEFLGLEDWKWFVLLMVIFSGMLVTHWVVHLVVFFIEWKFLLKKNLVYFTHALKTNVEVFIWISLVLATWVSLFKSHIKTARKKEKILDFVTWTLVSMLIGSFMWLIKTTLIKMLASSFHLNRFFDRIQEAVFHHYVLQTLSGRPAVELASSINRVESPFGQVSFTEHTSSHAEKKVVVDWGKLHQMKQEKVPSWTMKLLVDVMLNSGLSTVSGMLEKDVVEGGVALDDDEISSEEEAIATAVRIYENMVRDKDDQSYIDRYDLHRFLIREEVNVIYPLFEANEKGQVSLRAFSQWVVKMYKDRQALQHALNDNKTAVQQLNKLFCGILVILIVILWLLLTEIATTKVVLFFSSQLVVAAFIFGNTAKTIFEAIIFVFVMHPFDVGDRCMIDETMMLVEEMNILTTVFLKPDNQKLYYPNAVLATKSIGNFYRSPDQGDNLEFSIDYATPLSKIGKLKERVKQYLELNPVYWHPSHSVVVKEIVNLNAIKMVLYFNHTMNFQDVVTKNMRRTELVLEMKNIFDEVEIRYNLLPQEIHLKNTT